MTALRLERAVHRLALASADDEGADPAEALATLEELGSSPALQALAWIDLEPRLEPEERRIVEEGDVAEMYRLGVHPLIVRLFAAAFGIDYVKRYAEAGLR